MQKIIIVGATSGIGLALVEAFVARGWLVGAAGRNTAALERVALRSGGKVVVRRIDILSDDAPRELAMLARELGGMDVYLHVAGIGVENPRLDPEIDCRVVETNAVGFTRMIDAARQWFLSENDGRGRIAAITSVAGGEGIGAMAAYSASKAFEQYYLRAIDQLSRKQHTAIKVTDIRPGWIRTPLLDERAGYPLLMTVDYAVKRIVRAIEHGRRVAVIDWRWNILAGLWRLIPRWLWVRVPVSTSPFGK